MIELAASKLPKNHAFQLSAAGLGRGRVVRVGPPVAAQPPQVEQRRCRPAGQPRAHRAQRGARLGGGGRASRAPGRSVAGPSGGQAEVAGGCRPASAGPGVPARDIGRAGRRRGSCGTCSTARPSVETRRGRGVVGRLSAEVGRDRCGRAIAVRAEDPCAEEQEAQQRRHDVGSGQHHQFNDTRSPRGQRQGQRARPSPPGPMPNTTRPCAWWRSRPGRPRTPNVNQRLAAVLPTAVSQQRERVRPLRRHGPAQHPEQHPVGQGAQHADHREASQLARMPGGAPLPARPVPGSRRVATGMSPRRRPRAEPPDPSEVLAGRVDDVHAAAGVVDPVDRHLVDAHSGPFGEHEQLGVEEPLRVLDQRQQLGGRVRADRLEAALRVGEPGAQAGCARSGCRRAR